MRKMSSRDDQQPEQPRIPVLPIELELPRREDFAPDEPEPFGGGELDPEELDPSPTLWPDEEP